ncbi:hypothetical protein C1H46_014644 [Malus baccata]|uniref:Kinesin motor domain-containing protein n=1 Tax=Malus baccata TaxID=106549 RepID=A0A540MLM1_MALBA|nr:hypothetical protein C1H46_014644 [Malus baccata]
MVSAIPAMVTQSDELKLKFDEGSMMSKLCLVNLGGNESLAKTTVHGESLKEAQHIKKPLSALGDVISTLSRIKALNRLGHVDEENANAISLSENVVDLSDSIEDEVKWVENLIRGIFAGNIFDLGYAMVVCVRFVCEQSGALDHGKMVYFTYSTNSFENEAVVAEIVRRGGGALRCTKLQGMSTSIDDRRIYEYLLMVGFTGNSHVTNAQLDLYAKSEANTITGISYIAIKITIQHWINFGTPTCTAVKTYISSTNLKTSSVHSSCVRQPKFILCTSGYLSAFTPTYSTLLIGTEPHSKRVKVTLEVLSDVLHDANKKHRCESCSQVQTIPIQWVIFVQLHQHAYPKPTIFCLEQLILKHGTVASVIESQALVIESLQMG